MAAVGDHATGRTDQLGSGLVIERCHDGVADELAASPFPGDAVDPRDKRFVDVDVYSHVRMIAHTREPAGIVLVASFAQVRRAG